VSNRARIASNRVTGPATVAVVLAALPLAAQQPGPVTSGVAQVQLSATMLPAAHLEGSSRMVGWRRSESGQEATAALAVLPNAPYRLVVYRVDGETPAVAPALRRVWVAGGDSTLGDGTLQEVRSGAPVVIRSRPASQTTEQVSVRVRVGVGDAGDASRSELPLRYEIQVEPTL
jgi:hypothetical protein